MTWTPMSPSTWSNKNVRNGSSSTRSTPTCRTTCMPSRPPRGSGKIILTMTGSILLDSFMIWANTKYGMYEPHCGLDNLLISWSHDEYMYQFLKHNKTTIPDKRLYMIRYHSLYPWHAGGDYRHLTNGTDEQILQWVLESNKYDLYTKSTTVPDIEALWLYYEKLIAKYLPAICEF